MKKLWIFDLDDTLMWTQMDYERAKAKFCMFVYEKMQQKTPKLEQVLDLEEKIDCERFKDFPKEGRQPFDHTRFPGSLRETFRQLCEDRGVAYTLTDLQTAYSIGMQAFDYNKWKENGMAEGARETIKFLKNQGDSLFLMTKGDSFVQRAKLVAIGAQNKGEMFDDVKIVWDKNQNSFRELIGLSPPILAFSVGDSYRSDMVPALQIGMNGVYIPAPTVWRMESILDDEAKSKEFTGRMWTFKKIGEIMERYDELESYARGK